MMQSIAFKYVAPQVRMQKNEAIVGDNEAVSVDTQFVRQSELQNVVERNVCARHSEQVRPPCYVPITTRP